MSKVYEVTFDDILTQSGLNALESATTEYLKAECNVTPTGDDWKDNLELDDAFIGIGENALPDAEGAVFSDEISAKNFSYYLRDKFINATVITHNI